MKCITCKKSKIVNDELWCSLNCKIRFLEYYFSEHQLQVAIENIKKTKQR